MKNEVLIMYKLNHPYILKLFNHFEDDFSIHLILEFAPGVFLYFFKQKYYYKINFIFLNIYIYINNRVNYIQFCGSNHKKDLMKRLLLR